VRNAIKNLLLAKQDDKIRLDIQALRALAVLSVVIYHLWPNRLTGGFMGVDIFFVISGYLMTATLLKALAQLKKENATRKMENGRKLVNTLKFLVNFYARRIKRLVPAACVCLLLVLAAVFVLGKFSIMKDTAEQVFHATTFTQNLFLADQRVDYLGSTKADTAVQHFWSLSVEEQFYMIWPLLLLAAALFGSFLARKIFGRHHRLTKTTKWRGANFQAIAVILFTAILFFYGYNLTHTDPAFAYFFTPARIWELSLGGIICFLPKLKNRELGLLLPWLGLALCVYSIYKLNGVQFPGWHALIPTVGTALIIYGGTIKQQFKYSVGNLSRFRPCRFIGDISYSMYLYYCPLMILAPLFLDFDLSTNRVAKLSILAATLLVGAASYKFIETPTRKLKWKNSAIIVSGLVLGGLCVGSSLLVQNYSQYKIDNTIKEMHARALDESDVCFGARAILRQDECSDPFGVGNKEYEQFATDDFDMAVANGCDSPESNLEDMGCIFGDKDSDKTVLLWGDSHAMYWADALDQVGKNLQYKVNVAVLSSCNPAAWEYGEMPFSEFYNEGYDKGCVRKNKEIFNRYALQANVIILATAWFNDQSTYSTYSELAKIIDETSKSNIKVHIIQDSPWLKLLDGQSGVGSGGNQMMQDLTSECYEHGSEKCVLNNTELYTKFWQTMEKLKIYTNNFNVIKTEYLFCKDGFCPTSIGETPVYRDLAHMTGTYSATLGEWLTTYMNEL
jgi:peptidoglycan/LPS O-acetylase OafA/YrhL